MLPAFREHKVLVDNKPYVMWYFPARCTAHCSALGGIDLCDCRTLAEAMERMQRAIAERLRATAGATA